MSVRSFGSTNVFLGSTTKDRFPSHVTSVWAAASILPGPGTQVTPVISQAPFLSHLALLFPKDIFMLGTVLGWAQESQLL